METLPLVSVGIPTYNRPEGLRRILNCVTKQTYSNLEIIVSDNCSSNPEVQSVAEDYSNNDNRIIYIRQSVNIGMERNFTFVLDRARGSYFIWAADDDEWLQVDFLDRLLNYSNQNILTFSSASLSRSDGGVDFPLKIYEDCRDKFDYLKAFCSNGLGHPFYGLYNLSLFKQHKLEFKFDGDLMYYAEGTFLHKVFLTGLVKYVKDAKILFSTDSAKPTYELRINNFVEYFKRTLQIYANTNDLSVEQKSVLINEVLNLYIPHLKDLFRNFVLSEKEGIILSNNILEDSRNSSWVMKIRRRIVRTARVFVKGYY